MFKRRRRTDVHIYVLCKVPLGGRDAVQTVLALGLALHYNNGGRQGIPRLHAEFGAMFLGEVNGTQVSWGLLLNQNLGGGGEAKGRIPVPADPVEGGGGTVHIIHEIQVGVHNVKSALEKKNTSRDFFWGGIQRNFLFLSWGGL